MGFGAMDAAARADALEAALAALGTPERAEGEKRYLKSDLTFHGTTVWQIERAIEESTGRGAVASHDELVALVEELWRKPVHERRMAATILLERERARLTAEDLPLIERLTRESKTWAYVDALAGDVAGAIGMSSPAAGAVFDRWATDPDFWVRRSALLAQLRPLRHGAPFDRFAGYADAMLDEKEFFIRKAIGWVLREVGKRRPDEVVAWLAPRTHRASGVTMREAVKYLPAADRERLMAAYQEKRPTA
jgi:3-methyladenine DNA glycosylase AlkD